MTMGFTEAYDGLWAAIDALRNHVTELEGRIEDQEIAIEQLRYEGPAQPMLREDDYDYYTDGEWEAM